MKLGHCCVALGVLALGCRAEGKKPEADKKGKPVDQAQLKKLYAEAGACGNRYKCPPAAELLKLAEGGDETVLGVSFDVLADSHTMDTEKWHAEKTVAWWIDAAVARGDEAAKKRFLQRSKEAMAKLGPRRVTVYNLVAPTGRQIPGAQEFLLAEMENPTLTVAEIGALGMLLGPWQKDLTLAKRWVTSDNPRYWRAAVQLIKNLPHDEVKWEDEVQLVSWLAKKPDLPEIAAFELLDFIEVNLGPELKPALEGLAAHKSKDVQSNAKELLAKQK